MSTRLKIMLGTAVAFVLLLVGVVLNVAGADAGTVQPYRSPTPIPQNYTYAPHADGPVTACGLCWYP